MSIATALMATANAGAIHERWPAEPEYAPIGQEVLALLWPLVLLIAGVASIYPLIDLLAPGNAIRFQIRSAEARDSRIGRQFQRWLKVDPTTEAWSDPGTRRRVRYLGAGLLVAVWVVALAVIAAAP